MKLRQLPSEVQVKLVEFAWEAAGKAANGGNKGSEAIKPLVGNFGQALDGLVRSCGAAGTEGEEGRIKVW
jgi:hypothetical protein